MGSTVHDPFAAEAATARSSLVRRIRAEGGLTDPSWRAAFEQVPRHLFVPYYFVGGRGGYRRLWCADPDPDVRDRWLRGAYEDVPLATRLKDGVLVSSSSQPSLMALMLDETGLREGSTVLEIGAGTGYNAALLAHRLGDDAVTTVDLDPDITEAARSHLAAAGHRPAVVTGDGARGCPARAPYDAVIATCTLGHVPAAWIAQCRPGARILAPLATGLISLRVRETPDGPLAEGNFLPTAAFFVPLRGAESPAGRLPPYGGLPRRAAADDRFRFLLDLGAGTLDPFEALAMWEGEGRPGRERYGITAGPGGQWAWLDDPAGAYVWPLTGPRDG
ncbi:methyltransferase domain-containing protein [uncultured Streptomyces sp.]|uniref:methyltransferase domain-containing protein n=1 Tax=uncultured Streptomyces sp. TaxID=174707 RepID=UPI002607299C|nr:methyltransferase domain-containing protein [uncultured Streptomyces sp.]